MKTQRLTFIINFTLRQRLFNLDPPPTSHISGFCRRPSTNCKRGGKELKITARLLNFQIRPLSRTEGKDWRGVVGRRGGGGWIQGGGRGETDGPTHSSVFYYWGMNTLLWHFLKLPVECFNRILKRGEISLILNCRCSFFESCKQQLIFSIIFGLSIFSAVWRGLQTITFICTWCLW